MPAPSGRSHRNARLTLIRLLDHCDYAMALSPDEGDAVVRVAQVKKLILEEFGGDPRALTSVPALPRCEEVDA